MKSVIILSFQIEIQSLIQSLNLSLPVVALLLDKHEHATGLISQGRWQADDVDFLDNNLLLFCQRRALINLLSALLLLFEKCQPVSE
jgi:hypothetical protein